MSSFRTLNIGTTALVNQKYALDITGQNIANAATPGYARQRVITSAIRPQEYSFGAVGTGVEIRQIKHMTSAFLEQQVRSSNSSLENLTQMETGYSILETYFNELTDNGLSVTMDKFWNALNDWNNNVEDVSTRRNVTEVGMSMAETYHSINANMRDFRLRTNEEIRDLVGDVNSLTSQVAQLNADIVKMEKGGVSNIVANDLRDQRTELLKTLSGLMDVTINEEPNGAVLVSQRSRLLVFENQYYELETESHNSDDLLVDRIVFASDKDEVKIGNGRLRAMLTLRDETILGFKQELDTLAAGFIWEFNRIHSQGVGLNAYESIRGTNGVQDTNVPLNELAYNFEPVGDTYKIENGNFEIRVFDAASETERTLNIKIDLDGNPVNPDTILYQTGVTTQPDHSLVRKIQDALDQAYPQTFNVGLDLSNRLEISSSDKNMTFGFGRDTSGVLAALGLNTFFDGYNAGTINVNDRMRQEPNLLAGARSLVEGDQENTRALLDLRDTKIFDSGQTDIDDFYEGIIGRLGIEGARVKSMLSTQRDIHTRMENQREQLSGVNLDEELTKMIQYQRSYQSAARFISTADSVLETLINM